MATFKKTFAIPDGNIYILSNNRNGKKFITMTFFIGLFLLLSACHNNKKAKSTHHVTKTWQQINSWSFKGKMAINDGNNSGSGRIKWQVKDDAIQADFKAPLGQGSWHITEDKNKATFISSANGESFANNAQQLISNELGWQFPWNKLQYWLRGHHSQDPINTINQPIETITDSGWHIMYSKWTETPLGFLPKKIKASKPPYSVKLVIYKWDFE